MYVYQDTTSDQCPNKVTMAVFDASLNLVSLATCPSESQTTEKRKRLQKMRIVIHHGSETRAESKDII